MAYDRTAAATTNSNRTNNDNWKADGFLNLYLPSKQGGRRKLGAIPLKSGKASEKQLIEWLAEDPTRVGKILSQLEMEYQSATPTDSSGFALPE